MDTGSFLDELQRQGLLLRSSARQCPLSTAVPSCPGWTLTRLVGHVTRVHRWATAILRGGSPDGFEFDPPEDEDELFEVYDASLAGLLDQLRATPDRAPIWTIQPATSAKLFWARRLAHETAIHRVDAQLAVGFGVQGFDPAFAVDGIEELLAGSGGARFDRGGLPGERTIALTPLDSNASWTLLVSPQRLECRPLAVDDADLSVFGLASDLYCWVWNRAGAEEVNLQGDLALADLWRQDFRVNARPKPAPDQST